EAGKPVDGELLQFLSPLGWEHINLTGDYVWRQSRRLEDGKFRGTVAKLAMRQPFVLFKGLTFQKLCLPGAFRPGDHHNKMLRPG
ncbi:Tn3 family transposase, partial [Klebsiella pneumoniae]|uniref:Tn3 family transposase n=1 Tax=Klebsiella pneumoniae TaxID=573 RepID=UPI00200C5CE5